MSETPTTFVALLNHIVLSRVLLLLFRKKNKGLAIIAMTIIVDLTQ